MTWAAGRVSRRGVLGMMVGLSMSGCARFQGKPDLVFINHRDREIEPRVVLTDRETQETVLDETLTLGPDTEHDERGTNTPYDNRDEFRIDGGGYHIKITLNGKTTTKNISVNRYFTVSFDVYPGIEFQGSE